ncbi:MAG: hypothetical protein ABJV04_02880 [Aliiglaciecola sp.]|uniref:hypothetical protein n=1 Tax=Aliiglaciecola sp. TaxID=1872441 RepID=UPI003297CFD5
MAKPSAPKQLTLRRLLNTDFSTLYQKLLLEDRLEKNEYLKLLSISIVLANQDELLLKQLAYRIILKYSINSMDYAPLYDFALNHGLIPLAKLLEQVEDSPIRRTKSTFITEFSSSYVDSFKDNEIYRTEQQLVLNDFVESNKDSSIYIVAPTSYGKSDLIISSLGESERKVCILVPSKSLLSQTKKRILDSNMKGLDVIVTHPEMYDENPNSRVFLLTQ